MPQIGWFEILLIVFIAIIVVGPKDFPIMLRKIGSWIRSVKKYVGDVQNQVSSITEETIDTNIGKDNNHNINEKENKKDE